MSTDPTVITEALTAADPTAAEDAALGIESIKEIMDAFDPASLLPELDSITGSAIQIARFAVMAGPIVILALGLLYLFASPKEANHSFGYRCYFGMGSVEAWRFTQRLAGIVLGGVGLILTVVMFFVVAGFGSLEVMELLSRAMTCLIWEIGLSAFACLGINVTAMIIFNRKGEYRKRA